MTCNPESTRVMTCNHELRGGGLCQLDAGHRGRHSSVFFLCDGCGKRRRGQPHQHLGTWDDDSGLVFCFMCCLEHEKEAASMGWDG